MIADKSETPMTDEQLRKVLTLWVEDGLPYPSDVKDYLAQPSPPSIPCETIEEVITWAKQCEANLRYCFATDQSGLAQAYAAFASRLRALLPTPPLVIEPGRWYRTRDGRKACVAWRCGDGWEGIIAKGRGEAGATVRWDASGRYVDGGIGVRGGLGIIAPWEDADEH